MIPRIWTIENIYILFSGGINEDITENILIFLNYNKMTYVITFPCLSIYSQSLKSERLGSIIHNSHGLLST